MFLFCPRRVFLVHQFSTFNTAHVNCFIQLLTFHGYRYRVLHTHKLNLFLTCKLYCCSPREACMHTTSGRVMCAHRRHYMCAPIYDKATNAHGIIGCVRRRPVQNVHWLPCVFVLMKIYSWKK